MAIAQNTLLMITSAGIGEGEMDLSVKLMENFLKSLFESASLPARIIFMNTGVFLTTEGSPLEDLLRKYEEAGSKIQSCGTCLNYYDRKDKLVVGEVGNMKETVAALQSYEKVIQL